MSSKDKVKIYLSNYQQKRKPASSFVKTIQNSILSDSMEITLAEFANQLTNFGRTSILCQLESNKGTPKKKTRIVSQELVMLDFDNKEKDNLFTLKDLAIDKFIKNNAIFWYKTFSDKETSKDRFRVVFKLDKILTKNTEVEHIYRKLHEMYPQADTTSSYPVRLFYGSTNGYTLINWNNTLNTEHLLEDFNDLEIMENKKEFFPSKKEPLKNSIILTNKDSIPDIEPIWQYIKSNQHTKFMEIIDIRIEKGLILLANGSYASKKSFVEQVKQHLNIRTFLGLPDETPFIDIFHIENEPSSTVFITENGYYLYKCFSENHKYVGDLFTMIRDLMPYDATYNDAIIFLSRCLHAEISPDSRLGLMKESTDLLGYRLMDPDLKITSPYVYSLFRNNEFLAKTLLDVLVDNVHEDLTSSSDKLVTFISLQTITNKCNALYAKIYNRNLEIHEPWVSKAKVSRIINLLTLGGVTNKLSDEDAPPKLVKSLHKNRITAGNKYKYRNEIYEIDVVNNPDLFKTLEEASKQLFDKGFVVSKMGYNYVLRTLGDETANKLFSQIKEPDRGISKKSRDFETLVVTFIFDSLKKDNYLLEDKLILAISRKLVITKKDAKEQLGFVIQDICNKYGLSEQRFNKAYRDIYNPPKVKTAVKFYIKERDVIQK